MITLIDTFKAYRDGKLEEMLAMECPRFLTNDRLGGAVFVVSGGTFNGARGWVGAGSVAIELGCVLCA